MNNIEIYTKNGKKIESKNTEKLPENLKFLESLISNDDFEYLFFQMKDKVIKITKIISYKIDKILENDNIIEQYYPSDIGESGA